LLGSVKIFKRKKKLVDRKGKWSFRYQTVWNSCEQYASILMQYFKHIGQLITDREGHSALKL
jgi:hypothetical protein